MGKLKILVVDDEPEWLDILSLLFTRKGWDVQTALSGEAAWSAMGERSYDLVLCDLSMPDISGISLAKELHKLGNAPAVVLMSSIPGFSLEAWKIQAYGFIEKPYTKHDIVEMIERYRNEAENKIDGSF